MVPFAAVIPARYASTRFPGKPLADLAGKPMVVRVCERARESGLLAGFEKLLPHIDDVYFWHRAAFDALGHRHEIRRACFCHLRDKGDDGLLGRGLVP